MDLRRLRPAEWLLTAAAVSLVVALFLPWYGIPQSRDVAAMDWNAWQSFAVIDIVLFACAVVASVAVFLQATQRSPALPIVSSVAATWAGLVASVLVVVRLIERPDEGFPIPSTFEFPLRYGAWIALGAALAILLAGWWAMRDERPGLARSTHLESSG